MLVRDVRCMIFLAIGAMLFVTGCDDFHHRYTKEQPLHIIWVKPPSDPGGGEGGGEGALTCQTYNRQCAHFPIEYEGLHGCDNNQAKYCHTQNNACQCIF